MGVSGMWCEAEDRFDFFLGTHRVCWLWQVGVPLFVSRRRLAPYKKLRRATCRWALDSGAFSELSQYGHWTITARQYVDEVTRWRQEIRNLEFAAVMDWMCEPFIIAKTGLSIGEHQKRTIDSYLELKALAPALPWIPILQGWRFADYCRHAEMYDRAGVALWSLRLVGVGSVCRRENTRMAEELMRHLCSELRLQLHAFGFKVQGVRNCHPWLNSADSMAWSYAGRRRKMRGCEHRGNCANCLRWALHWRERVLNSLRSEPDRQPLLF